MPTDDHALQRFVDAQQTVYPRVRTELASGRKTSHWMWFVFPQLVGLGESAMSQRYGIRGIEEAAAYLAHPLLGRRLHECTSLVLALKGVSAAALFGHPDDLKFQSCMTLFSRASSTEHCYAEALDRYYRGQSDGRTEQLLAARAAESGGSDATAGTGSHAGGGFSDKRFEFARLE